jgi:hypothetical protein
MRSDMAKVIVERPRAGWRLNKLKGESRRSHEMPMDEWARRDRMRGKYIRTKHLTENLGPLRRFLDSCVGRPWDKVFAEICANINRNSAVQDHVRDHVSDFVEIHVVLIDGMPCSADGRNYGSPLRESRYWQRFYVCPKSGLLKRIKGRKRCQRKPASAHGPPSVKLGKLHQCRFLDGHWYLIDLKRLPPPEFRHLAKSRDVVLDRPVASLPTLEAVKAYGGEYFAVAKRLLTTKEQKQFPIPLDK